MPARSRVAVGIAAVAAVLVLVVLALAGVRTWHGLHRSALDEAADSVPAATKRFAFTDWALVRERLHARLGRDPGTEAIQRFTAKAYDADFSGVSSIDESAAALQEHFGFSPATIDWEAYAQSRAGAALVVRLGDGTDTGDVASRLRTTGFTAPEDDGGVWVGGADLVASLDPTLTPELQYVVLLRDQGLVVTSDSKSYAARTARVARGDAKSLLDAHRTDELVDRLHDPAAAMLWAGDFACEDLAMSQAADQDQADADRLVAKAGGVTPLSGLAMALAPDRRLTVAELFEDGDKARRDLRPRARLAVGEAPGRGGSFSDDLVLESSRTDGPVVLLRFRPRQRTGYVLSGLDSGPVLFATC